MFVVLALLPCLLLLLLSIELSWFLTSNWLLLLWSIVNFLTCLALTLLYLSSLTFSMKSMHLSKSPWVTMDANLALLWLPLLLLTSIVLFMHLTLSCSNCLSAYSIIFLALALIPCLLLSGLHLILTGTKLLLIHFNVKILWHSFPKFLAVVWHLVHIFLWYSCEGLSFCW